ncbi:hypothetical protein EYF80_058278 [Liparis tanakae]|uniref:Uncharacterized protein n=1 Tax=Liparis tanakae TaxID=230148 RepID=A0A4Z2ESJ9_9TELE|nr:hypothetical protein EYF80_058278 [Liparis tanakae]
MFAPEVTGRAPICIRPWARFFPPLIGLSTSAPCLLTLITLFFSRRRCYSEFSSDTSDLPEEGRPAGEEDERSQGRRKKQESGGRRRNTGLSFPSFLLTLHAFTCRVGRLRPRPPSPGEGIRAVDASRRRQSEAERVPGAEREGSPLLSPLSSRSFAVHARLLRSFASRRFESSLNAALVFCGGFFSPGSRRSLGLSVKTFSLSARHLQTVPFVSRTYLV